MTRLVRRRFVLLPVLLAATALSTSIAVAAGRPVTPPEIDALAVSVAGEGGSVERTQRLVSWMTTNLEWVATDYERRTPEQILARGAGNCAELSSVLERLLKPATISYRWIAEINVQPESDQRQRNAAALVEKRGPRASVFGRRHNDHRWLEVFDDRSRTWVPADPAAGLVGVDHWIRARMSFDDRPPPAVPAIADVMREMIVPIAVLTTRQPDGSRIDRSAEYLVQALDALYGGKAHLLPSWSEWTGAVRAFAPLARDAFDDKLNLHEHAQRIDELAATYDRLRAEARAAGLH
jgi:hypothetical protein